MKPILEKLQPLGRALMLPIAVLPVAGLMLRLGQPDLLDIGFLGAAGDALFAHLGLLFAIGVATGYARDGNGAACLSGIVCFLVATEAGKALLTVPAEVTGDLAIAAWKAKSVARLDVPAGILSGLIGGVFYNRFSAVKLPDYLSFFGGRRFVPIVAGAAGLVMAVAIGLAFAHISAGVDGLSRGVAQAGGIGLFVFGVLNRLLLVTGLHHILNNVFWFVQGDYNGVAGDLRRFFAGDPAAGGFMAGFFPVMMFGLPAACLAMYRAARPERRKAVGGMLFSLALTSTLTGVTEPIEFSFMFLAPALFALHALLTGAAMVLMDLLGVKLGFGFSAGLFDYVLNYGKATKPLLLLPVGLGYFALYYVVFAVVIRKLDLKTPGRDDEMASAGIAIPPAGGRGAAFVQALGGTGNLTNVGACTTRLRLIVADQAGVDDASLKALGARGIIRPSANALQVVLGPIADAVAVEIRDTMAAGPQVPLPTTAPAAAASGLHLAPLAIVALGGAANIRAVGRHGTRLRVELVDPLSVTQAALMGLGVRAVAHPGPGLLHLLLAPDARVLAL